MKMLLAISVRLMAVVTGLVGFMVAMTCIFSITGFLGRYNWLFDLTCHFRLQYFLILAAALVFYGFKKSPRAVMWVFLFLLVNLSQIISYYMLKPAIPNEHVAVQMNILQMNLWKLSRDVPGVMGYISANKPDILALEEYTSRWHNDLTRAGLLRLLPYRSYGTGVALYSRYPFKDSNIRVLGTPRETTIISKIDVQQEPVTIIVVHPRTPITDGYFSERNRQYGKLEDIRREFTPNLIMIGDLNTTPWSYPFQDFLKRMGLSDTEQGFGLQPSWPTFLPPMRIPIDHCLVSGRFVTLSRQLGPFVGSDHFPVHIRLGLLKSGKSFPLKLSSRINAKIKAIS